jgi:hypothetical protein
LDKIQGIKATAFFTAIWFIMLLYKGFGLFSWLKPQNLYHIARLLLLSAKTSIPDLMHELKNSSSPSNSYIAKTRQEFKHYQLLKSCSKNFSNNTSACLFGITHQSDRISVNLLTISL